MLRCREVARESVHARRRIRTFMPVVVGSSTRWFIFQLGDQRTSGRFGDASLGPAGQIAGQCEWAERHARLGCGQGCSRQLAIVQR